MSVGGRPSMVVWPFTQLVRSQYSSPTFKSLSAFGSDFNRLSDLRSEGFSLGRTFASFSAIKIFGPVCGDHGGLWNRVSDRACWRSCPTSRASDARSTS
jgi:hypothetical protein